MKNTILLFGSLFIAVISFGQEKFTTGVRAGFISADMRGDAVNNLKNLLDFSNGAISTSPNTGLYAGAYASIPVSDLFSVEPGLYYSQKGYQVNGEFSVKGAEFLSANGRAQLNTQYIDMPVVLKANLGGFQVFLGPQVSYLASADLKTTAGAFGFNVLNSTSNVTDQFNRWDAAATGGVGYKFSNGLNISASYDHGLSKVNSGQNLEGYNRAVKVGVGYSF